VVDADGKGLFILLEGMLRYLRGQSLETSVVTVQPLSAMNLEDTIESIEPGQDYEIVVDFRPHQPLDLDRFYSDLSQIGTSIQVGEGDGMYRMHIHVATNKRYEPIDYTMGIGTVMKVAIENLDDQLDAQAHQAANKPVLNAVEKGQTAVVAISPGAGITRIFASLGVAAIVEGGQTMNPSTEEILKAFENLPTEKIIILPNNKNIILAAQAAASVTVKRVTVIHSASIPQGLSAMLHFSPESDYNEMVQEMTESLNDVVTGEITTATRTVEINGVNVQKGEVIAMQNGKLVYSASSIEEALLGLLAKASAADHERITLFYGADLNLKEVNHLADKIRSAYPAHELEIHEGGQPHYQFIIAIE